MNYYNLTNYTNYTSNITNNNISKNKSINPYYKNPYLYNYYIFILFFICFLTPMISRFFLCICDMCNDIIRSFKKLLNRRKRRTFLIEIGTLEHKIEINND